MGSAVIALASVGAVANGPRLITPGANASAPLSVVQLDGLLAANRLTAGENIKALPLHRDGHNAILLVQVRGREPNHYHADSNITVLLLEGRGILHVGGQSFDMVVGDSALVPRGRPHYFVNTGPAPAAALVVYAPPPGKDDRIIIE